MTRRLSWSAVLGFGVALLLLVAWVALVLSAGDVECAEMLANHPWLPRACDGWWSLR